MLVVGFCLMSSIHDHCGITLVADNRSMSSTFLSRYMAQRSSQEMLLICGAFEFLRTLYTSTLSSSLS